MPSFYSGDEGSGSNMSNTAVANVAPPPASSATMDKRRRSSGSSCCSRPLVYITRRIPQKGIETLLKACDVKQWDSEIAAPRGELLHSVVAADGILCMPSDVIDVDVMDAAGPNLRVIATVSSETDHIDLAECKKRNVEVIGIPSQPTDNQAELTVALVLLTIKETLTEEERILHFDPPTPDVIPDISEVVATSHTNSRPRLMRRHSEEQLFFQWSNGKLSNSKCSAWQMISRKTFGVYGLTQLGMSVANLLKRIGVGKVLVADCDSELDNADIANKTKLEHDIVPFSEMRDKAEIICVCGSIGDRSENVFCRETFKKMSKNSIIVTSQSDEKAIDYIDLYEALRDGQIKAAGLNDCNQEAVPFKEPFMGLRNCIFLPQTQESVYDLRHKVSCLIAQNLIDVLQQKAPRMTMITE